MLGSEKALWSLMVVMALSLASPWRAESEKHGAGKTGPPLTRFEQNNSNDTGSMQSTAVQDKTADEGQYVGAETCKSCHEDVAKTYDDSPHARTPMKRGQGHAGQGCEACHGAGREHAEAGDPAGIIRFAALSREQSSKRCLQCHECGQEHASGLCSRHLNAKVGCIDCHSIHAWKIQAKLLKNSQPQLCRSCHGDKNPKVSLRPSERVTATQQPRAGLRRKFRANVFTDVTALRHVAQN